MSHVPIMCQHETTGGQKGHKPIECESVEYYLWYGAHKAEDKVLQSGALQQIPAGFIAVSSNVKL